MTEWDRSSIGRHDGEIVVITGANSGLGLETARVLGSAGAHVVMACRSESKATAAIDQLRGEVPGGSFEFVALDLADLQSVRDAAAALRSTHPRVDILVNNAGLMALDEQRTAQGFEMQFGVNHLGHVALTFELLPHLASSGRVVTVSSMGHRMGKMHFDDLNAARGYDRWTAYFQSKLANLLFGLELQRRLTAAGSEVQSLVAHPGGTRTDLGTEGSGLTNTMMRKVVPLVTQSVGAGALPIVRACVDRALPGGTFVGCRFMAVGRPVVETPSKRARSEADAQRLWTMSEQLIGATSPV